MTVDLVQAIVRLPAVATFNWAQRAAEAMLGFEPASVVSVTIANVDAAGRVRRLEVSSVAGATIDAAARNRFEGRFAGDAAFGWQPKSGRDWYRPTVAMLDDFDTSLWKGSSSSRHWESVGAADLLIATAPLATGDGARVLVVEIGGEPGAFTEANMGVLGAVLQPITSRAALAFGADVKEEVRKLTPREEQVLGQLALGKSVKQIATELRRSPHTVHDHVKSLHAKLGASSRGELVARALGHVSSTTETDPFFGGRVAAA